MSRRTLEDRIEAWPEQWKAARARYVDAKGQVAKLELQLERVRARAAQAAHMDPTDDAAIPATSPITAADRELLELDYQTQLIQLEVERAKAAADMQTRAAAQTSGLKLTEAAVEARVKSDATCTAAQQKLLEARHLQALAKLERDAQWRTDREEQRMTAIYNDEEESEPPEVVSLREEVDEALAELDRARTELAFQHRIGRTLRMLADIVTADSAVAAVPMLSRRT
jgi:hypothetical protein